MPVITMRERETEEKSREEEGRDRNRWLYRRCYPSLGEEERCNFRSSCSLQNPMVLLQETRHHLEGDLNFHFFFVTWDV